MECTRASTAAAAAASTPTSRAWRSWSRRALFRKTDALAGELRDLAEAATSLPHFALSAALQDSVHTAVEGHKKLLQLLEQA